MTQKSEWTGRVGESWAHEWRRTDRSFGELTDRLLQAATSSPFSQVVDVGCGAGEVSLLLAAANPSARVTGVDVSESLLAAARLRGAGAENVAFVLGDASQWQTDEGEAPDLIVSRHGVMFFPEPVTAFEHLRSIAQPGARLVFSCFRERRDNQWAEQLTSVLGAGSSPADPRAPGPFAFGDADYVEDILAKAGWTDVRLSPVDYEMVAGEGTDALEDAVSYFLRIGPAARAISEMKPAERDRTMGRLREMLDAQSKAGRITLPAASWVVTATRAD